MMEMDKGKHTECPICGESDFSAVLSGHWDKELGWWVADGLHEAFDTTLYCGCGWEGNEDDLSEVTA